MFWMRNKENKFPIHTLIWRPALKGIPGIPEGIFDQVNFEKENKNHAKLRQNAKLNSLSLSVVC